MIAPSQGPQSLSALIQQSFQHWRSTLKITYRFIGALITLKTMALILFLRLTHALNQQQDPSALIGLLLLVSLVSVYLLGCCFLAVFADGAGKPLLLTQVMHAVRQRALVYLGAWFICAMMSLFGALFFLIPGIVLYIYTKYAKLLALFDKTHLLDSVVMSLRLVSRHWWRVFAVEAFIVLASFGALLAGQLLVSILIMPLAALFSANSLNQIILGGMGTVVGIMVVQIITVPLIVNVQLLQFYDLKCRHHLLSQSHHDGEEETIVC